MLVLSLASQAVFHGASFVDKQAHDFRLYQAIAPDYADTALRLLPDSSFSLTISYRPKEGDTCRLTYAYGKDGSLRMVSWRYSWAENLFREIWFWPILGDSVGLLANFPRKQKDFSVPYEALKIRGSGPGALWDWLEVPLSRRRRP